MDIAFYIHQFPKLSETFILNQVIGLLDRGHEVTIFANEIGDEDLEHDLVTEYDLRGRTVIVDYPESVISALSVLGVSTTDFLRGDRSLIKEIPHAVRKKRLGPAYLGSLNAFREKDKQFDLHHAHFGTIGLQWEFLGRQSDAPFVTTFYGFDVSKYVHPSKYDVYEGFWGTPDLCLGITHHIRSRMILLGCPEEKSVKHPIGIDPELFEAETKKYRQERPLRIATVGRLTEKKGIKYAIDAVARCVDEGLDLEYHIGGDGERRAELERRVDQHGVRNTVTFRGWLTQSEVTRLLSWGDLFLLPSVTGRNGDMEGQALVLQEAQAKALPVISTYHNGIPEGVVESETARLVPERDVKGLSQAIKHFIGGDQLQRYSHNARQFVRNQFDNADILDRQVELYEDLVDDETVAHGRYE